MPFKTGSWGIQAKNRSKKRANYFREFQRNKNKFKFRYNSCLNIIKLYRDKSWLYQKYIVEKLSSIEIAKICKLNSNVTILNWLRKFNIKRRTNREQKIEWHKKNPHPMLGKKQSEEAIKKIIRAPVKSINKIEKLFDEMTSKNIQYIGDRSWWIKLSNGKYKNPDFKIKGKNKVIEIWGDYWHRNDDPQELINQFKNVNFDCLIINENEIYNQPNLVLKKVENFIERR